MAYEVTGLEGKAVRTVPARFLHTGWRDVSKAPYYEQPHVLAEGFWEDRIQRAGS